MSAPGFCPSCHHRPCLCEARPKKIAAPKLLATVFAAPKEERHVGDACPDCGALMEATGAPLWEVYCPKCPINVRSVQPIRLVFDTGICFACKTIPCQCSIDEEGK